MTINNDGLIDEAVPITITHMQLFRAVQALGIDPRTVSEIHITPKPRTVRVILHEPDKQKPAPVWTIETTDNPVVDLSIEGPMTSHE